jgi:hypothetical protein
MVQPGVIDTPQLMEVLILAEVEVVVMLLHPTPNSGSGGSGVVILSMPDANYSSTTTGSPTVTTGVGRKYSFNIYRFMEVTHRKYIWLFCKDRIKWKSNRSSFC